MLSNVDKWNPKKRIGKVIIPYILWTFIYVVLYNKNNISIIPLLYVKKLIQGTSAAMMYYVFVYCQLTLLIPLIDKLSKSKLKWLGFFISIIEIIIMRVIPILLGYSVNNYISMIMHVSCIGWFIYFYLGYLIGNSRINITISSAKLIVALIVAIALQILEGYWYLSMGVVNCGTQLKLSAILTGIIAVLLSYNYLLSKRALSNRFLKLLGDKSFGIYFCHIACMCFLGVIPFYKFIIFPFNAIFTIVISVIFVFLGEKVLGKFAKYLAL